MIILAVLAILSIVGIGVVLWLLKNEQKSNNSQEEVLHLMEDSANKPQEDLPTKGKSKSLFNFLNNICKKLNFSKKDPTKKTVSKETPLPSLKEYLDTEENEKESTEITAEPTENKTLSHEEKQDIKKEIGLSEELNALKEKFERLDILFSKKSHELEETHKSLENELAHRKEFNKVKDLLEKELKDSKDRTRHIQMEFTNAENENNNNKKRIIQLEEKISKLEKNLLEKEDKISQDLPSEPPTSPEIPPDNIEKPASPEEIVQNKQFLKLQPDVLSEEPEKEISQETETKKSLEISTKPNQSSESDTDQNSKEQDQSSEKNKIIEIIDPEQPSEAPSNNQESDQQDNNNDNTKEG